MTPLVSVIIPCRNEVRFIGACLDSVLASEYPADKLEVIVADGMSEDGTREQVDRYAARDSRLRCIDNPARVTPIALNLAIKAARGDLILRLDAHARLAPDYIAQAARHLETREADCVGGAMLTVAEESGRFAEPIRVALSHPFGVGNSHFRLGLQASRWVDTVYGACWRREVFDRVGGFSERLERSQDIEFSSRLRRAGGKILLSPQMRIQYYARSTAGEFWRQNVTNGMWAILPFGCASGMAVRWRHLAPLALVMCLAAAAIAGVWTGNGWMPTAVVAPYVAANLAASVHAAWRERSVPLVLWMPVVFAGLHVGYGAGSVWGCGRLMLGSLK